MAETTALYGRARGDAMTVVSSAGGRDAAKAAPRPPASSQRGATGRVVLWRLGKHSLCRRPGAVLANKNLG
jgi:hypothetical protein